MVSNIKLKEPIKLGIRILKMLSGLEKNRDVGKDLQAYLEKEKLNGPILGNGSGSPAELSGDQQTIVSRLLLNSMNRYSIHTSIKLVKYPLAPLNSSKGAYGFIT